MTHNRREELRDIMTKLNHYKTMEQRGEQLDTIDCLIRDSIRETARQIMKHYGVVTGKTTNKANVDALKQA